MRIDEFVKKVKATLGWAQEVLLNYLLKPLKLLLEMNDVTGINWKKISRMMPTARRYALDRAPTIEEMRFMLANSGVRFQAILLTMARSGIRIGAWDYLNWGHVEPIFVDDKVVAAKMTVYAGEPEEYITFIAPEAYNKLKQYIALREEHGKG